jgi:hypothetical protein
MMVAKEMRSGALLELSHLADSREAEHARSDSMEEQVGLWSL